MFIIYIIIKIKSKCIFDLTNIFLILLLVPISTIIIIYNLQVRNVFFTIIYIFLKFVCSYSGVAKILKLGRGANPKYYIYNMIINYYIYI